MFSCRPVDVKRCVSLIQPASDTHTHTQTHTHTHSLWTVCVFGLRLGGADTLITDLSLTWLTGKLREREREGEREGEERDRKSVV